MLFLELTPVQLTRLAEQSIEKLDMRGNRCSQFNRLILSSISIALLFWLLVGWGTERAFAADAAFAGTPDAIISAAHFAEPLVRTAGTTSAEDVALQRAVVAYERRVRPDDVSSLTAFLRQYPRSGWASALQTNLGLSYLHDGYFSKAIEAWRAAWEVGKNAKEPRAKALVDRAVGELVRLYTAVGQFDNVAAVFRQIGNRPISGSATEAVQQARETLTLVTKDPRHLFNCGPVALKMLVLALDPNDQRGNFLQWYRAGPNGTNFTELGGLAQKAGLSYRIIRRAPGQAIPIPAVVHWKVGHFAVIVGKANGRYRVEDPGFPGSAMWVTQAALDAEASGYFLIPNAVPTQSGWTPVSAKQAAGIWGKGPTNGTPPGDPGDPGAKNGGNPPGKPPKKGPGNGGKPGDDDPNKCPMCAYDIKESAVSLTLSDLPVGYIPPIGPSAKVRISYNQREDSQPAVFNFFNVSPKWTLDWLTYVIDDPTNPGASVSRFLSGGGAYYYSGYSNSTGRFAAQFDDGSVLVLASQSPVTYRHQLSDGTVEIYSQSDGATSYPRKIFLSQVIDPQGNAATLSYDGSQRLTTLTDATGRQTTFSYTEPSKPLLVTKITDPFGRFATLNYDTSGRLSSITDILGLTSSFTYDANSLVNSMTTPYGTTTFAYTAPGTSSPPRFVDVTDPMGFHEREEWLEPAPIADSDPSGTVPQGMPLALTNQYLTYRDSFYWDKEAYVAAACTPSGGCDYTKARNTHFTHVPSTSFKSTTMESRKYPLENRVWYNYTGQTASINSGSFIQPIAAGRVLDDGTTQLYQYSYDTGGYFKLRHVTDPLGRVTTFSYSNQIDLAAISQATAYGVHTTLAQFTYNTLHRPVLYTDAAGQTTRMSYNAAGQLTAVTDPLGRTTSYQYGPTGNLSSITNANNVTAATYTYDSFNRIATYTDSEGWTVAYSYDAADRLTKATYPDGTAETYAYNRLDRSSYQDRLGRNWRYAYDSNRRMTALTDPNGQQTAFTYNRTDQMASRTDPKGYTTSWAYDLQGRMTTKTYFDSSTVITAYENTISRIKTVTDALGQIKQFSYAKDNLPLTTTYASAVHTTPNVSFAYDPYFPRVVSRTDGVGTTQFSYVPVGTLGALSVQQEATPLSSGTITYAYDELGRVASRTVAGSSAETFQYDTLGRLNTHAGDLGSFAYSYLGETDQVVQRQLASSTLATNWTYLPNSGDRRLASVGSVGLSSGNHTTFAYTTNVADESTGVTQTSNAAISYPPGSGAQTASYNNLNQLTNLSGQSLTYDAVGNLTSDGSRNYIWDAENRLVGITYSGVSGKATTLTYDGLGRRATVSNTPSGGGSTVTTSYIWCGSRICQARNSGGTVTRAYYAEGEFVPGSPGTSYYYGVDQLGSARRVYTTGSAPTYDYDSYGNPLQATTPLTDFGYAGMFYHADSGLYLTTHRPYDPVIGRFLSRDPIGEYSDSLGNLYAYVGNSPTNAIDPVGLQQSTPIPGFPGIGLPGAPSDWMCWITGLCNPPDPAPVCPVHNENNQDKPPPGSKPINNTPWSGDHQDIKSGIGAGPSDNVKIDPKTDNVWGENPDGSWTNHGPAGDYTGSGRPSGRRGKDRR